MKKIRYSRSTNAKKGSKRFTISQKSCDDQSITRIRKQFRYIIKPTNLTEPEDVAPEVFIVKQTDSNRKIERFSFEVKGVFYISHQRMLVKVEYHHTLHISILWKEKSFSSKQSAALTK